MEANHVVVTVVHLWSLSMISAALMLIGMGVLMYFRPRRRR